MKQVTDHRTPNAAGRRAFLWNMIGSVINAGATMLLTIVATRLAGVEQGGILGLAFGLCQVFATFANCEVRPFQSTDLDEQFRFGEYYGLRILTCAAMTVLCAAYVFGFQYSGEKALVIFSICMFKMLDAFSDVFQGLFQQQGHLEYAGQALALRVFLAGCAYTVTLWLTQNSILAAVSMPAASVLCIVLFDMRVAKRFVDRVRPVFSGAACRKILSACLPLFASSFMNMYILNATKMQVDAVIPQMQGYWTPLYMPAAIINLFSIFAFRPMLTTLRAKWNAKERNAFRRIVFVLIGWVIAVTLGVLAGAWFLGIPVLQLLYGLPLAPYRNVLMIVLLGGGLNALATVLYYVITIMRRQYFLLLGDGVTFAATLLITPLFVRAQGLAGAGLAYLCSMAVRAFCLAWIAAFGYRTYWNQERNAKQ